MVISRMVSPHATHRGKAAGSGGLSIGAGVLQPGRGRRLSTSDHSPGVIAYGLATAPARSGRRNHVASVVPFGTDFFRTAGYRKPPYGVIWRALFLTATECRAMAEEKLAGFFLAFQLRRLERPQDMRGSKDGVRDKPRRCARRRRRRWIVHERPRRAETSGRIHRA